MKELIGILRDIAAGRKNQLGDYWHTPTYVAEAADRLEKAMNYAKATTTNWQWRTTDIKTGKVVCDWRNCSKEAFDRVKGKSHQGTALRVDYRVLYDFPALNGNLS